MSIREEKTITCRSCKKSSNFIKWKSINTMIDPHMKSAVRDLSAFHFTCPYCGREAYIDYGFLYHQQEDKIMIYYADSDEDIAAVERIAGGKGMAGIMEDIIADSDDDYLFRIVLSQDELLEKLSLFDSGLDDRIIEIYKVFILNQYMEDFPEVDNEINLFYFSEGENHLVQIFADGKPERVAMLSREYYEMLEAKFGPCLPDIRKDEIFINKDWAIRIMQKLIMGNRKA